MQKPRLALLQLLSALVVAALLAAPISSASALTRLDPPSSSLEGRAFEVIVDNTSRTLSLGEIEALGLYRIETTSPWESGRLVFDGVLLRDVLRHVGLAEEPAVLLRAIDGYTQMIPREDWQRWPALIATRHAGKPLGRRDKGPTRLVYPLLDHPQLDTSEHKSRWIWLIDTIEPDRRAGRGPSH